jgi:tyrosyl-tRNA synthetase
MSRLTESVTRVMHILDGADLGADYTVAQLLGETTARRSLDLSDLSPQEQAALVEGRAINLIPSAEVLAEKIEAARTAGRPFVVKYGIDPTSPDVHLGHAVPIIIASRFQRMGHHVVFIIGDVTAKIGDPSGRSSERPPLTDENIARNLSGYQQQVTPFIDFERADLRFNGGHPARARRRPRPRAGLHVPTARGLPYPPRRRPRAVRGPSSSTPSSWPGTRWPSTPTSNSAAWTSC